MVGARRVVAPRVQSTSVMLVDYDLLESVRGGVEDGLLKRCQDGSYVQRYRGVVWYRGKIGGSDFVWTQVAPDASLKDICPK